ncbi:MAG: cytochrome c [Rhodospirillaceae bacterium]|jgi:mono/diheme cytochrome c family protein|nr:cytochrome c [Rhodospirillaceae bacterium]
MRRIFILAGALFLVASPVLPTSGAQAEEKAPKIVEPKLTGKLMLGKLAFGSYCAECHGEQGGGTDKGPPFLHRVYHPGHHADGSFYRAAKSGARAHHWKFGDMAPVPKVTDPQLENIVKYIRALQQANGLF